jgi:hypothetical protein
MIERCARDPRVVALIGAQIQARFESRTYFPPDALGGIAERIGYFLIGGQSAASHNGRSSPRWLMEWIGRVCMRRCYAADRNNASRWCCCMRVAWRRLRWACR